MAPVLPPTCCGSLPSPPHLWQVVLALSLLVWSCSGLQQFCQPETANFFCSQMPMVGGVPDYNGPESPTSTTKPWVIGQTEVVSLSAGEYSPGGLPSVGMNHVIFVVEGATLIIEDIPDGQEVSVAGSIFICDQASFIVRNSFFRSAGNSFFEYIISSSGTSSIIFKGAKVTMISTALEQTNPSASGAFLMMIRDSSTLEVTTSEDPAHPYGLLSGRNQDVWEIAVVDNAVANITTAFIFGEYYIAGNAVMDVSTSLFFDVVFEICEGSNYALTLPDLCSLDGQGMPQCLTAQHPDLDWSVGPPATPFTLNLSGVKVFAMILSTYIGSTIEMGAVGVFTNMNIGVNMDTYNGQSTFDLVLPVGLNPTTTGLDSTGRSITLSPNTFVEGWQLWPESGINVNVQHSVIGDFNLGTGSNGTARYTEFPGSQMALDGSQVDLWHCTVNSNLMMQESAFLRATNTTFGGSIPTIRGSLSVADSTFTTVTSIQANGVIYEVEITSPSGMESTFERDEVVDVLGTVRATGSAGPVAIPSAFLDVIEVGSAVNQLCIPIVSPSTNGLLGSVNMSALVGTQFKLELHFEQPAINVPSIRFFSLPGSTTEPTTAPSTSSNSVASSTEESSDSSSSSGIQGINATWFFMALTALVFI